MDCRLKPNRSPRMLDSADMPGNTTKFSQKENDLQRRAPLSLRGTATLFPALCVILTEPGPHKVFPKRFLHPLSCNQAQMALRPKSGRPAHAHHAPVLNCLNVVATNETLRGRASCRVACEARCFLLQQRAVLDLISGFLAARMRTCARRICSSGKGSRRGSEGLNKGITKCIGEPDMCQLIWHVA